MLKKLQPFNLDLLVLLGDNSVKNLKPIKVLDIMSGMTKNFHPEGLYSNEIFGKVGEATRATTFAYIDLHIPVFHPVYYKVITDLKELYGSIISGKAYAVFDNQLKDFIKSDPMKGQTGFKFFLEHFDDLKFEERESAQRTFNLAIANKYKNKCLIDKVPVLPAGLRDYTIDENGKPSEDEINTIYRKLIGSSSVVSNTSFANNEEYLNSVRYSLQMTVNDIYSYFKELMEGKGKLIQGKWVTRNIDNSTRNVITPYIQRITSTEDPQFVSASQQVVGTYQFIKAIFPKSAQLLRDGFLSSVFIGPNAPSNLVDPKTLKNVSVLVDPKYYDQWMTVEGIEKLFARFKVKDLRHNPVMIGKYYLGLIYVNNERNAYAPGFRFLNCISELKDGLNKESVRPITYAELFYTAVCQYSKTAVGTITRYPIERFGSIYPGYIYLKSTIKGIPLFSLDENFNQLELYPEMPTFGDYFFDALSPSSLHLPRLGGDYDGDMTSLICYITDDAKKELQDLLNSRDYYVTPDKTIAFTSSNDIIDLVLSNIS